MNELTIEQVLEHYGADLSRVSPVGWKPVRCPFTDRHSNSDRNASGSVNLNLGRYRCHACGIGGNAINVIKEREGLDFKGAVAFAKEVLEASVPGVRITTHRTTPRKRSKWRDQLPL